MPTAILVDGSFFLKRYKFLAGGQQAPRDVADAMHRMCLAHLNQPGARGRDTEERRSLYRIFYYDCPPLEKKVHHPLTRRSVDFSKSDISQWRFAFLEELRSKRKVALRQGYLNDRSAAWQIKEDRLRDLLSQKIAIADLVADDVFYHASQKGVDMRIGIDIASMAFKRQVDQIILVSGDSDFVPAAKLARREGIDFILDPMHAPIRPDLNEHIDGLMSTIPRTPGSLGARLSGSATISTTTTLPADIKSNVPEPHAGDGE